MKKLKEIGVIGVIVALICLSSIYSGMAIKEKECKNETNDLQILDSIKDTVQYKLDENEKFRAIIEEKTQISNPYHLVLSRADSIKSNYISDYYPEIADFIGQELNSYSKLYSLSANDLKGAYINLYFYSDGEIKVNVLNSENKVIQCKYTGDILEK